VKTLESVSAKPTCSFPHDKVIGPKILMVAVRSSELEDRLIPMQKINCAGDRVPLMQSQGHKALLEGDDMFMNFFEKRPRLRRNPMKTSSLTVKIIEGYQGFQRVLN
jgi:hypothetical protein